MKLIFSFPLSADEGTTKTFACARPLIGQYVAIQLVGVESSLSLCEVEVFSNDGMFAKFENTFARRYGGEKKINLILRIFTFA